jgi:hypothetical protein
MRTVQAVVVPMAAAWLGLVACAGLSSCARSERVEVTSGEGAAETWPATAPTIDISNFNGRVDLVVDSRLNAPSVSATGISESTDSGEANDLSRLSVQASLAADGSVYKVVAGRPDGIDDDVRLELSIRVPSAGSIKVYNRGGPVKITGAPAGVQVENGRSPGQDDDDLDVLESTEAWIQVRTGGAIEQPVALVTDYGDVTLILGNAAKGDFTIQAPGGMAYARARVGSFDRFRGSAHEITARYNQGTNPVLLRTEHGDAYALMMESPETYSQRMW